MEPIAGEVIGWGRVSAQPVMEGGGGITVVHSVAVSYS